MLQVIDCLTLYHDYSLVALAVLVCVLGCGSTAVVAGRAVAPGRPAVWTLLLGLCVGATAWATHFIAMLAYRLSVPISYAAGETVLSLLVGLTLVSAGFGCTLRWSKRMWVRLSGGALVGAGVLALHYIGMSGMRFSGSLGYAPDLVAGSIVAGLGFGMAALGVMFGPRQRGNRPLGAMLLLLMTLSLHFLGMGATEISVGFDDARSNDGWPRSVLAFGVAVVSLAVLMIGIVAALVDRQMSNRLAYLAGHDALTDLPNRRHFCELSDETLAWASRTETSFALFAIDLDDFKSVNDVLGHAAGDTFIRTVGRRVADVLDEDDVIARLGGDEFALIQLGRDDIGRQRERAEQLAAAVYDALGTPIVIGDAQRSANASIGIALYPEDGDDVDTLLRNADTAMYRAKARGKGISLFFEASMNAELDARRRLETRLRLALGNDHLHLAYQPLVNSADRSPVCFEALLRWDDEVLGSVAPDEFIPVAESTGLIVPIGEFVLTRACLDAAAWPDPIRVAVNLSAVQFARGGLVDAVRVALERSGLPGRRLELEVTESLLLDDRARTLATLGELRALGVEIAMDDFGTGYSSLGYLQSFEFDKIKIDRSFVYRMESVAKDAGIVRAAIAIGRSLGMRIVAEGVETDAQAALLAELECDELQGYLIARPMPADEIASFLEVPVTRGRNAGKVVHLAGRHRSDGPFGDTANRDTA